jgi:hypothetical protein
VKAVLITDSHFETDASGSAVEKFKGGKHYPLDEASQRQVDLGNGVIVDAPDDAEKAAAAAETAEQAAEKAAAKADAARQSADAAAAAAQ